MTDFFYGINKRRDVLTWAQKILTISDFNEPHALALLIETCAAETRLATFKDPTPYKKGLSLCQIVEADFLRLQDEFKTHWISGEIFLCLGVDLDDILFHELENNPDYGFLFCMLHYYSEDIIRNIPDTFPGRARLWKEYFNESADSTVETYIENCRICHTDALIEGDIDD
jgi:hypothetical protein